MKIEAVIALFLLGVTLLMPYSEAVWQDDVVGEHSDLHHHTSPLNGNADFLQCPCNHSHLFPNETAELPQIFDRPLNHVAYYANAAGMVLLQNPFKPPRV